jgi:hypothetical protein
MRVRRCGPARLLPTDLVGIDKEGRLSWNNSPVGARRLGEYMQKAAASAATSPPYFLLVRPDKDAPCAAVQTVLEAAVRIRRCSPSQCSFDKPPRRSEAGV